MGEELELLEGPSACPKSQVMRVRVRAVADEAVGWATVQGNQGTVYLEEVAGPEGPMEE